MNKNLSPPPIFLFYSLLQYMLRKASLKEEAFFYVNSLMPELEALSEVVHK